MGKGYFFFNAIFGSLGTILMGYSLYREYDIEYNTNFNKHHFFPKHSK